MGTAGVIGLGDMGSGLAKNLLKSGFEVYGYDLSPDRMSSFVELGGKSCDGPSSVGSVCDCVFVMVMNGEQAKSVIFGDDSDSGLLSTLRSGSAIIMTATTKPSEVREISSLMSGSDVHLVDSPVSGGFGGAQGGTLTMMASGSSEVLDEYASYMEAVSSTIHRVGDEVGMGQTVKACLQSLIGSIFSATFEASVLAAKAGVSGQVLYDVFSTSSAGCGCSNTALENIIDRKFERTGSHINTMHKDLTIALDLGEELCVPLHTASIAMQIFHSGKSRYPDGDNWVCTRVIEEIVGSELHR